MVPGYVFYELLVHRAAALQLSSYFQYFVIGISGANDVLPIESSILRAKRQTLITSIWAAKLTAS